MPPAPINLQTKTLIMKIFISVFISLILLTTVLSCSKEGASDSAAAGGSIARMAIKDDYLYIVTSSTLFTYDISNPAETVLLSSEYIGWSSDVETIFPYRDKLFIGSRTGMFVFDISDPKTPKQQGQVQHFRACDPVVANSDFAYVTLRSTNLGCGATQENSLNIYDIQGTKILSPSLVGRLELPEPQGLGFKNKYLYVCCGNKGLYVINIENANNPVIAKKLDAGETFVDVIPYNNTLIAYISGGFILYDISNPSNPIKQATVNN